MDIPFHNRWSGSYVIQPRHMGGFYKSLLRKFTNQMRLRAFTFFKWKMIITIALIFLISSCTGCATIAAITEFAQSPEVQETILITQPFALTRGK
jgi:hypothetical protein